MTDELKHTIKDIAVSGKGILAADEGVDTAAKRLASINVSSTEETRRQYRNVVLTAPGMEQYISGVILFEETLRQKSNDNVIFPEVLRKKGIVPGIKVDLGRAKLNHTDEEYTLGLQGLGERLEEYKKSGCRFTKWRAVYSISENTPSDPLVKKNAEDLAKYAKICQDHGFVPIVEPEVLIDGDHSIDRCQDVSEKVLTAVFDALKKENIAIDLTILKPSMVISGKQAENRAGVQEVAKRTFETLKKTVPSELPSINFLSGGQGVEEATAHLNAIHTLGGELPWNVSFSYARALQGPALKVWKGKQENLSIAQEAFIKRAKLNGLATLGKYSEDMEKEEQINEV